MRILLVGNYEPLAQQSMGRFAEMMRRGLEDAGHDVRLVRPPARLGRLANGETELGKWLGYIDRFLLYPPTLRRQAAWADVVHICDQANAPYISVLRGTPHVLTCHDMLAVRAAKGDVPGIKVRWTGRIYQRWILNGIRKAQRIVCVSEHTAREVRAYAEVAEDQLAVVPNALNYPYRPMEPDEAADRLRARGLDPARPFFLHVGGNQWYKNRPGVVRLYAELVEHSRFGEHALVMAGKPWTPELRQLVAKLGLQGRVAELTGASNEDLRALYSRADALLFPSLQEGFGWPIIEAQACGCPVVTTNHPPMTEIGGDAALYVDPNRPVEAASLVAKSIGGERSAWVGRGVAQARRYSIGSVVAGYLRSYEASADDRGRDHEAQDDTHSREPFSQ